MGEMPVWTTERFRRSTGTIMPDFRVCIVCGPGAGQGTRVSDNGATLARGALEEGAREAEDALDA